LFNETSHKATELKLLIDNY